MIEGLTETVELLTKGSINKRTLAKSMHEVGDARITEFMMDVSVLISKIKSLAEIGKKQGSGHQYALTGAQTDAMNQLKKDIISKSAAIASEFQIPLDIEFSE